MKLQVFFHIKHSMRARVREILSWYEGEPVFVPQKLAQMLNQGALSGSGKWSTLTLESLDKMGPLEPLISNLKALQPGYALELAIESKVSALVAPLSFLKHSLRDFAGEIPSWAQVPLDFKTGVKEAQQLGCIGISLNFSDFSQLKKIEKFKSLSQKAGLLLRAHVESSKPWSFEELSQWAYQFSQRGVHVLSLPLPQGLFINEATKSKFHQLCLHLKKLQDQIRFIREAAVSGEFLISFYGIENREKDLPQLVSGGALGYDFSTAYFQVSLKEAVQSMDQIHESFLGTVNKGPNS